MTKRRRICFTLIIILAAIVCSGLCVRHYGMGVQPYCEEQIEDVTTIVREICWLEEGTVVEQRFSNSASYMVGVNLLLVGVGQESNGSLVVQLCDDEKNVLAQKYANLQDMEDGQFYPVRFLEAVDTGDYKRLWIRLYVEDATTVPGVVTVLPSKDVQDSINCRVNGESVSNNIAIEYIYGKWQYMGYEWKNNGAREALMAAIVLVIICSLVFIYFIDNGDKINLKLIAEKCVNYNNGKQTLYILWFSAVFLGASAFSRIRNNRGVPIVVYLYILVIMAITGCYFYFTRRRGYKPQECVWLRVLQDKGLIITILISTIIRIPLFTNVQLWDGSIYYAVLQKVCREFEYSIAYIWSNFRLCGHYAIVYTLFTSIGEFLFPDSMLGVLIVTLILTEAALICIYKMFRGYWLNLSQKDAAIGTMLVSVCPLFLGLFSNISLDYLLFVFTVFLFYAEYKEQKIMKAVWLISIMMTKETGLVIVAGYLLAHILVHFWNTIKYQKENRIQHFFANFDVLCAMGGIVVVCLYVISQNGLFVWFGMNQKLEGNLVTEYLSKIPESLPLFVQKMKVLFVLHFEWIPILIMFFCIIFSKINNRKILPFPGQASFLGTLGSFILVNFYLFDYLLGRYHIYSAGMIWILAYIVLLKTFRICLDNRICFSVSIVGIVLLFMQNFFFVDPVTNLAFEQYDTGRGKMISTEMHGGNFGDTFVNNFRHTYLYDLIDEMLAESCFDIDTQIIFPYKREYTTINLYAGYDKVKQARVIESSPDSKNVVAINSIPLQDIVDFNLEEMPKRGIMYFLPYLDCDEEEAVKTAEQFYHVSERREVSNWGGTMAYYVLEKK